MKLAVLLSGVGTLFEAMLDDGIDVSLVVADRPCRGLEIAAAAGVPTVLAKRTTYGKDFDRNAYSAELAAILQQHNIDLVAMAGFMTILAKPIFDLYAGKIINTHPSLLPAFKGERAVPDALEAGVAETGCTIHIATLELDNGPILAQAKVRVEPGDTVKSLHERIKIVERPLYAKTLRKLMGQESAIS